MIYHGKACDEDMSVLTCLHEAGCYITAPCGGRGTCGKCAVRFLTTPPEATAQEIEKLSADQIREGWRLACRAIPHGEFAVEYSSLEESILTETGYIGGVAVREGLGQGERVIAVDLGTTTIAVSLVDTVSGVVLDTRTTVNHQRSFGADVISRIQASNEGKGASLQKSVLDDLHGLIRSLGAAPGEVSVLVSGNTTMQHLLQGLDCHSLGVAPYTPVDISMRTVDGFTMLPGISTYVGADIVSGICACGMDESDEVSLLVDLGTNGEMAIGNRSRILVASTAAGPALEGGNISCGVAGIPGAISGVEIDGDKVSCRTIADQEPVGLCGTGVLETVYELLRAGIMDESGCLEEPYEDSFRLCGDIHFTQEDVREVQLAKAAIRAGMETLIESYGIARGEIGHVYLAGGFGQKIDLQKAAGIGLLPDDLIEKTIAVGNSSLAGAIAMAADSSFADRLVRTAHLAEELPLANNRVFTDYYIEYMLFEAE